MCIYTYTFIYRRTGVGENSRKDERLIERRHYKRRDNLEHAAQQYCAPSVYILLVTSIGRRVPVGLLGL